MKIGLSRWY